MNSAKLLTPRRPEPPAITADQFKSGCPFFYLRDTSFKYQYVEKDGKGFIKSLSGYHRGLLTPVEVLYSGIKLTLETGTSRYAAFADIHLAESEVEP
jgi:hypothetical protein